MPLSTRRRRAGIGARSGFGAGLCALAAVLTSCHSTTTGRLRGDHAPLARASAAHAALTGTDPSTAPPTATATASTPAIRPSTPRKPNACAHNRAPQLVTVSLRRQHLWMCDRSHVAYGTPITSGVVGQYTSTPTGHYTIQALDRHQTLTLLDGSSFTVDYWIPFDAPLYGFHDSPWQHFPYGSAAYRTRGSHGCVHMPHAAIAHLYRWAHVGTEVHIHA